MEDLARVPLDSCEHSMLNEDADETLGNLLCRRASRFSPGQQFQSFVSVRNGKNNWWNHITFSLIIWAIVRSASTTLHAAATGPRPAAAAPTW